MKRTYKFFVMNPTNVMNSHMTNNFPESRILKPKNLNKTNAEKVAMKIKVIDNSSCFIVSCVFLSVDSL